MVPSPSAVQTLDYNKLNQISLEQVTTAPLLLPFTSTSFLAGPADRWSS